MYEKPEDWLVLFEAVGVELPLGLQRLLLGAPEGESEVEQAVSKAHHAWVSLASAAVNALYVRTGFWDVTLEAFNSLLRTQRLAQTMMRVLVAGLGPSLGVASSSEVEALRDDLIRIRRDLRDLTARGEPPSLAAGGLRRIK